MPHRYRKTRAQYRAARLRLLRNATECTWCGCAISDKLPRSHPQKATADHYVPLSLGGLDSITNLVPCCFRCNSIRGNMSPEAFISYLRRKAPHELPDGRTDGTSRDW